MTWLTAMILSVTPATGAEAWWPSWRGPDMSGAVAETQLPTTWSETENIAWRVETPGFGLATPVIWGEQLFILTAIKTEREADEQPEANPRLSWAKPVMPRHYYRFAVMALNRKTGKTRWSRDAVVTTPHETTHGDASWASGSPATDGSVVIASFGSAGIFAYDLEGGLKWRVDLGDMRTRNGFGEGSSPAIAGDTVVINWDHEDASFITALDKNTGKERWRSARDEPTSWSTPVIAMDGGRTLAIVSATNQVRAYDLADGKEVWRCGGMTLNAIPSPIVAGDTVFAASGFRGSAALAIEFRGARGDLTGSERVRWSIDRDTPYVPSILLYQDALYYLKSNRGILTSVDAKSGEVLFGPQRLEGVDGVYASPIGAGGHVYVVGRKGATAVIKQGKAFELVAVNRLDDRFDASPAIAGSALYLRGHKNLYCIGAP